MPPFYFLLNYIRIPNSIPLMRVYLDNAATTSLDPRVLESMMPFFTQQFGNPSSIHAYGRESRSAIEKARKTIAALLNTSPSQIVFTSSATEAENMAIVGAITSANIKHVISSKIEHHAVLHTLEHLHASQKIALHFVDLEPDGNINYAHLEKLLEKYPQCLVSLMHGNNEIGNINDIEAIGQLCKDHQSVFHSDTVQTIGHIPINLKTTNIDFIVGSAHKFHGPKGIGFLYMGENIRIPSFIQGGAQERNMRGGTENVTGIVGLSKAFEIAYQEMQDTENHLRQFKKYLLDQLIKAVPSITFNGTSGDVSKSLHHIVSASFPITDIADMLLFNLDINGIAVSGGSACNSGASIGSHVLNALYGEDERPAIRFSMSKYTTKDELNYVVKNIRTLFS